MGPALICVVTTIQGPTACMRRLAARADEQGARVIVVGDRKGPEQFALPACDFYSLQAQLALPLRSAASLPTGHYARKNVGYLLAMQRGAACIYETDDDNEPAASWAPRDEETLAAPLDAHRWVNSLRALADRLIWPRGFPLRFVRDPLTWAVDHRGPLHVRCSVQQGMADVAPDVDAIWRLVVGGDFTFPAGSSRWVPPGHWHPFNSQSTWWWPRAYPLMYLPTTCGFRTTDIWRSFIAQRCLRELGQGVAHHPPEVVQRRNEHDLRRDFADEIEVQTRSEALVDVLEGLTLSGGEDDTLANLLHCYEALCEEGYFQPPELARVHDWIADVAAIASGGLHSA